MIATIVVLLLVLLSLGISVAATFSILGLLLGSLYAFLPLQQAFAEISWQVSTDSVLVAVPFFVLLGEIFLRAGLAVRMYTAMAQWVSWLPGGLMHSNIGACALFAATSGSSVATAATIGTVAVDEIPKHGYSERLFLGSLAAGGTLGILIPPSINLIIYGAITNTSIPQLYLAGFVPGFLLAFLFSAVILACCLFRPAWGGRTIKTTWRRRMETLPDFIPPLCIFMLVVGSIYLGLATPTESAALGVVGALGLSAWNRQLTVASLKEVFEGTIRTTGMIMAILFGAYFLNFVMASIGLAAQVENFVGNLGLSPFETLIVVILFYMVLGMFMETLSMMVMTIPITAPLMTSLGYDPVWFGIVIIILIEMALITPPVGINLYVLQGVRGRGRILDVMVGSLPFVLAMVLAIILLIAFPEIALFLPAVSG
jgi:tripartite ATP-independent transporter DctM subunit